MITLYGQNGQFETEVLKRRLKQPYTFKALGIDFNIDTFKGQYGGKAKVPAVIKGDKVLSDSEIEVLINGEVAEVISVPPLVEETPEVPKRPRPRATKKDQV